MSTVFDQLKEAESQGQKVFKYKLNPTIKAFDLFKELKSKNYSPELEDHDDDLYLVVALKPTKIINMIKPVKRVISVEDNLITVQFGQAN